MAKKLSDFVVRACVRFLALLEMTGVFALGESYLAKPGFVKLVLISLLFDVI
jgi:hypothetical protein